MFEHWDSLLSFQVTDTRLPSALFSCHHGCSTVTDFLAQVAKTNCSIIKLHWSSVFFFSFFFLSIYKVSNRPPNTHSFKCLDYTDLIFKVFNIKPQVCFRGRKGKTENQNRLYFCSFLTTVALKKKSQESSSLYRTSISKGSVVEGVCESCGVAKHVSLLQDRIPFIHGCVSRIPRWGDARGQTDLSEKFFVFHNSL